MKNKRAYWILWFVSGSLCSGQATQFFMTGGWSESSYLISFLVVVQFLFGFGIAFYGWKNYRLLGNSKT